MDPFSEIFSSLRVSDAITTRLEATAPWGWRSSGDQENRINFVLVQNGSGILTMHGNSQPIQLVAGDVFIMLDGEPYTLVDHQDSRVVDCSIVEQNRVDDVISFGGGGELTTFVSGAFAIDDLEAKPILSILPRFLHLRLESDRSQAFQLALDLLALEVRQSALASKATIARLYEVLFVYAIRAYINSGAVPRSGWLAAISDKQLSPAVMAMHENLEQDWTLDTLAAKAYMSRSAFAAKFKSVVGQTPLEYLTQWRIHRAKLLIRDTSKSVAEIAYKVGYESESSFNRVFKRSAGITPGAFRRSFGKAQLEEQTLPSIMISP